MASIKRLQYVMGTGGDYCYVDKMIRVSLLRDKFQTMCKSLLENHRELLPIARQGRFKHSVSSVIRREIMKDYPEGTHVFVNEENTSR